jgi:CheY-like chemotaxis protein
MKVLCVEDNSTHSRMIDLMLAATGVEVDFVRNGEEAVEAYQEDEYDAILMDIQMPVKSGIEATREIRQIEEGFHLSHCPILLVTSHDDEDHINEGHAAGGDGFLKKPFTSEGLLGALDRVLIGANRTGLHSVLNANHISLR